MKTEEDTIHQTVGITGESAIGFLKKGYIVKYKNYGFYFIYKKDTNEILLSLAPHFNEWFQPVTIEEFIKEGKSQFYDVYKKEDIIKLSDERFNFRIKELIEQHKKWLSAINNIGN